MTNNLIRSIINITIYIYRHFKLQLMNKKLILHVGLPKTGSSALQNLLHSNRDELIQLNINYPLDDNKRNVKHQSLVKGLFNGNNQSLKTFLDTNKSETLILSTEGLTNHLYDYCPKALSKFRDLTINYETTICLVIRNKEKWLKSYYSQSIINPKIRLDYNATSLKLNEFKKLSRITKLLNTKQLTQDLQKAYGAHEIVTIDYSPKFVKEFCFKFIIPYTEVENKKINITPNSWTIELIRQINGFNLNEQQRKSWKAAIQQFSQTKHNLLAQYEYESTQTLAKEKIILASLTPVDSLEFPLTEEIINKFKLFLNSFDRN